MAAARAALSASDCEEIEGWVAVNGTPRQVCLGGRVASDGKGHSVVARELAINRKKVTRWREPAVAYADHRLFEHPAGGGRSRLITFRT